jgi:hypothetical protein
LLGTCPNITDDQIRQYFRGKVMSTVGTQIGQLFNDHVSFLNIAAHLEDLSESARLKISPLMLKYGINLETFYFESISVNEDDPSYIKLKQIKEKSAELSVVGRDIYQLDRSMDVLKTAAGNEGMAGLLMQSGVGTGMGLMMGAQIGQEARSLMTQVAQQAPAVPPPLPSNHDLQFYVVINNQSLGPLGVAVLQQMIAAGAVDAASMVWRQGLPGWQPASMQQELLHLFQRSGPPPVPSASFPPAPSQV